MEDKKAVSFYKITNEKLESLPIVEGQLIFVTDTKKIYLDNADGDRIQLGGSDYVFEQDGQDGHKITIYPATNPGQKTEIIIPDNDTVYTANNGITLTETNFTNSGVRSITEGDSNGTIKVNTNGELADVKVKGLGSMAYLDNIPSEDINGIVGVGNGGTGVTTLTEGQVLVGNGVSPVSTLAIDETTGGTAASHDLITSGAVNAGLQTKIDVTKIGANSGVAELDEQGLIPTNRIPGSYSNVHGYDHKSEFPEQGERDTIYVDRETNTQWRWDGKAYVEIGSDLSLGETPETAYRGDRGAAAYAHAVTNKGMQFTSDLYKIETNSEGHVSKADKVKTADLVALDIVDLNDVQALTNKTYNGYELKDACSKDVDSAIVEDTAAENIPTSKAVVDYVKSKAVSIPIDPEDTEGLILWIETK